MSIVSQEPVLFHCSIADNISYGQKDISRADIIESAKAANIHGFISSLPLVSPLACRKTHRVMCICNVHAFLCSVWQVEKNISLLV